MMRTPWTFQRKRATLQAGSGWTGRVKILGGDLNRSTQHFTLLDEVKCHATTNEAPILYGGRERRDLVSVAAR